MLNSKYYGLIGFLFLSGCICFSFLPKGECSSQQYADPRFEHLAYTKYLLGTRVKTPKGVVVDSSGHDVDLNYIDEQTEMLEACLGVQIKSCAVTVKVAPDFVQEPAGQWFPCKSAPNGKCAGINQYPNVLVLPPSLRAYRHELIHLVTHKDHGDPVFAQCDGQ